ncbi:MAG: Fe-S protein assembly co-chaperone HscB [Gemmataceae bacterium]
MDHFARLGMPRRFLVDAAALERAYLSHSRAVHPDYHAAGAAGDLAASTELSAAVNEAYNTLRDPFTRADYLLGLIGGPPASLEKGVEPAFLTEVMELRERAEDASQHAAVRAEIEDRSAALMKQVADGFEVADDAARLVAIRRSLNALKTLRSLARTLPED